MWQDIRYGLRLFIKNPVFTIIACLTLAIGIGANTAIFSVMNSVLLRPLPYPAAERLVVIRETRQPHFALAAVATGNFLYWRDQSKAFERMAAYRRADFNLSGGGEPVNVQGALISAELFRLLGINPAVGRDFSLEEEQPGRNNVALVSHNIWRRHLSADPGLGRTLKLNGKSYDIVGVMPPNTSFPDSETEVWTPFGFDAAARNDHVRHNISVIARLKEGESLERASAEMDAVARRLGTESPDTNAAWGVKVRPMLQDIVGDIRPALFVLFGTVAFVLLIACANIVNLLLARAASRQKEFAIRITLGAGRWRILRQLMTESLLLSLMGGALGLVFAYIGIRVLLAYAPADLPRAGDIVIDSRALAVTLLISLLTSVVFGILPALQAANPNLTETLKEGARGSTGGRKRIRGLLVVAEFALSFMLLVGAGLMIKSLWQLRQVNPGFQPDNVLTLRISLPQTKYPEQIQQATFAEQLLKRVASLPGVQAASVATTLPMSGTLIQGFSIQEKPFPPPDPQLPTNYYAVSPDYFRAMEISLRRGRAFTERDMRDAPKVAVINDTMARLYFNGEDPLGKHINISNEPQTWREIVGVVGDVKNDSLEATKLGAQTYVPYAQKPVPNISLAVRTSTDPQALAVPIRREVLSIDSEQPIAKLQTMNQVIGTTIAQRQFNALLLFVFAVVSLVLAAIGIYGVIAYSVSQRAQELGIRMALGAGARDILKLVLSQGMFLAVVGVALGVAGAFALTRVLSTMLFGVSATDPTVFAAIMLLLCAVALLACYVPARRATKVSPLEAIRSE